MTKRFTAALLAISVLMFALPALAGGRVIYRLALAPPQAVMDAEGTEAKNSYADMAQARLKKRFEAARVKEAEFRISTANTIVVETGWDHQRGWMEALMTAPGRVEVRRVAPQKLKWLGLINMIPEGLELRGDLEPHVWSPRRSDLESFIGKFTVPDGAVTVFPDSGGYRSVTLGEVIATERQVKSAKVRQSSSGAPFAVVDFEPSVGASLAALHVSEVEQIAIVLDGELVAFVPAKSFLERQPVRLSVPEGVVPDDRKQRSLWIRQVAGRLAAPLPIAIAVLKE